MVFMETRFDSMEDFVLVVTGLSVDKRRRDGGTSRRYPKVNIPYTGKGGSAAVGPDPLWLYWFTECSDRWKTRCRPSTLVCMGASVLCSTERDQRPGSSIEWKEDMTPLK